MFITILQHQSHTPNPEGQESTILSDRCKGRVGMALRFHFSSQQNTEKVIAGII